MNIPNMTVELSNEQLNYLSENVDAFSDEDVFCMYGFDARYYNQSDATGRIVVDNILKIHKFFKDRVVEMIKSGKFDQLRSKKNESSN